MTRAIHPTFRALLGAAAIAASAAVAQAQPPQDTTPTARRTTSSRAAIDRDRRGEPRAHPRDYYGADDPRCDDLCRRERMMDARYGKDRERRPARSRVP